jgi:hypothetical protein
MPAGNKEISIMKDEQQRCTFMVEKIAWTLFEND